MCNNNYENEKYQLYCCMFIWASHKSCKLMFTIDDKLNEKRGKQH